MMNFLHPVLKTRGVTLAFVALCALAALAGCGTDSDIDGVVVSDDVLDDVQEETGDDSRDADAEDDVDAVDDSDSEETEDVTDTPETDASDAEVSEDADAAEDSETEDDAEIIDAVEDTETIEDADVIEDAETVDDVDGATDGDGVDPTGGVGTPCATHCRCADTLFCDGASGTCQPIVFDEGFYCCSDGPEDCPDGEACDLDLPEGGEGVCGE